MYAAKTVRLGSEEHKKLEEAKLLIIQNGTNGLEKKYGEQARLRDLTYGAVLGVALTLLIQSFSGN